MTHNITQFILLQTSHLIPILLWGLYILLLKQKDIHLFLDEILKVENSMIKILTILFANWILFNTIFWFTLN